MTSFWRRLVPNLQRFQTLAMPCTLCATALIGLIGLSALTADTAHAGATAGWNEAVNGDFSNNGLAPNFVFLQEGISIIKGTSGRAVIDGPVDTDYFTITIPEGFTLDSMEILPGTLSVGDGSFIALMVGPQFTVPPDTQSAQGMLGWSLFGDGNIGSDVLLFMAAPSFGSSGYDTPLPAGQYSFWVQETGVGVATYVFAVQVTAVPEPATALTLLAGLGLLAGALKRRG